VGFSVMVGLVGVGYCLDLRGFTDRDGSEGYWGCSFALVDLGGSSIMLDFS
jgi:hypothetical protein